MRPEHDNPTDNDAGSRWSDTEARLIDASHCSMKALPSASVLTKLSALQHLNLSYNELTSLPAALATLPSIQTLDVSHNCLVELPLNLATHQSLQLLAAHNPLRLELPLDTARRLEAEDTLFVDPAFPANEHSLFRSPDDPPAGHPAPETVRWLRPHELCQVAGVDAPRLFVDSSSSSDVVQGALGDCWLLSALAVVALHRDGLLTQIFAPSACVGLPAGSLTVQFYCEGRWERVTIDDRIPCDSSGYPLYAHCVEPNEMWVPLLEKAYAKLKGSYQALTSGFVDNALVELTGGAPQRFRFQRALGKDSALTESRSPEAPISGTVASDIWGTLSLWMAESSPIGCAFSLSGVDSSLIASSNDAEGNGLLRGHAYGLEQLKEVAGRRLLRLRNPWGRGEWNGPWSDGAEEWTDELQALLDYDFDDDGTFWMELQDFLQQFNTLYVARLFGNRGWHSTVIHGSWNELNAGGSCKFTSWHQNPCIFVDLHVQTSFFCTISQPDRRKISPGSTYPSIGFMMLPLSRLLTPNGSLATTIKGVDMCLHSLPFRQEREVSCEKETELSPGQYVIIPFTHISGVHGRYQLSIWASERSNIEQLAHVDEAVQRALLKFDNPMKSPFAMRSSEWPSLVEHIDDKGAALTDQQLWEEVESDEEDDADFGAVDNSRSPLLERAQRMHDRMAQQLSSTHVQRQVEEMMQAWTFATRPDLLVRADDEATILALRLQEQLASLSSNASMSTDTDARSFRSDAHGNVSCSMVGRAGTDKQIGVSGSNSDVSPEEYVVPNTAAADPSQSTSPAMPSSTPPFTPSATCLFMPPAESSEVHRALSVASHSATPPASALLAPSAAPVVGSTTTPPSPTETTTLVTNLSESHMDPPARCSPTWNAAVSPAPSAMPTIDSSVSHTPSRQATAMPAEEYLHASSAPSTGLPAGCTPICMEMFEHPLQPGPMGEFNNTPVASGSVRGSDTATIEWQLLGIQREIQAMHNQLQQSLLLQSRLPPLFAAASEEPASYLDQDASTRRDSSDYFPHQQRNETSERNGNVFDDTAYARKQVHSDAQRLSAAAQELLAREAALSRDTAAAVTRAAARALSLSISDPPWRSGAPIRDPLNRIGASPSSCSPYSLPRVPVRDETAGEFRAGWSLQHCQSRQLHYSSSVRTAAPCNQFHHAGGSKPPPPMPRAVAMAILAAHNIPYT